MSVNGSERRDHCPFGESGLTRRATLLGQLPAARSPYKVGDRSGSAVHPPALPNGLGAQLPWPKGRPVPARSAAKVPMPEYTQRYRLQVGQVGAKRSRGRVSCSALLGGATSY